MSEMKVEDLEISDADYTHVPRRVRRNARRVGFVATAKPDGFHLYCSFMFYEVAARPLSYSQVIGFCRDWAPF